MGLNLSANWQDDYEVAEGFHLEIDSTGFHLPTAIQFVPDPGTTPKSPLYFVTEIRGAIKVVCQDRSVHTFADDFFTLVPLKELPEEPGEIGMAGLCLYPKNGYVFVSYAYEDDNGIYRNGLSRFQSDPQVFGLIPESRTELLPLLKNYLSSISHQIGPLAIHDDLLYVSVGDGEVSQDARNLDSPRGKILRMTLDGLPAPGNPHAVDSNPDNIRNYIWASGFRNPFSLKIVDGEVFVADNGPKHDRFVKVVAGDDFLYDGSDESIAINPLYLWNPAVSPVQMDYDSVQLSKLGFPEVWQDSFLITLSGTPVAPPGRSDRGAKSVIALGFDFESGKVSRPPKPLLNYKGPGSQMPVGLTIGPDGLYIVPIFPDTAGNSSILKLTYAPEKNESHVINELDPGFLIMKYSCHACHIIDGKGYGYTGPEIKRPVLGETLWDKLHSQTYEEQSLHVDSLLSEPYLSHASTRREIRDTKGKEKVRTWLINRLMEPRFDQQVIAMPNLQISEEEATVLSDWLLLDYLSANPLSRMKGRVKEILPSPSYTNLVLMLMAGAVLGGLTTVASVYLLRKR